MFLSSKSPIPSTCSQKKVLHIQGSSTGALTVPIVRTFTKLNAQSDDCHIMGEYEVFRNHIASSTICILTWIDAVNDTICRTLERSLWYVCRLHRGSSKGRFNLVTVIPQPLAWIAENIAVESFCTDYLLRLFTATFRETNGSWSCETPVQRSCGAPPWEWYQKREDKSLLLLLLLLFGFIPRKDVITSHNAPATSDSSSVSTRRLLGAPVLLQLLAILTNVGRRCLLYYCYVLMLSLVKAIPYHFPNDWDVRRGESQQLWQASKGRHVHYYEQER